MFSLKGWRVQEGEGPTTAFRNIEQGRGGSPKERQNETKPSLLYDCNRRNSYTTRGAVPTRIISLALAAHKDGTTAPVNNPPITCTTSMCNPSTNTLWLGLVSSSHLARDRHHLPAHSFIQWHKRMRTALQEHSLPWVLFHFTIILSFFCCFFLLNTQYFFWKDTKKKPLQNFPSLRRHTS